MYWLFPNGEVKAKITFLVWSENNILYLKINNFTTDNIYLETIVMQTVKLCYNRNAMRYYSSVCFKTSHNITVLIKKVEHDCGRRQTILFNLFTPYVPIPDANAVSYSDKSTGKEVKQLCKTFTRISLNELVFYIICLFSYRITPFFLLTLFVCLSPYWPRACPTSYRS